MEVINRTSLERISTRSDVTTLVQKVLMTSLPMAVWKSPGEQVIYFLFDLTGPVVYEESFEVETLHKSFVLNPYNESHPVKPTVLSGDIMIKVIDQKAEVEISPKLTSDQLDTFMKSVSTASKDSKLSVNSHHSYSSDFAQKVSEAQNFIASGNSQKIVLSRFEEYPLDDEFDPLAIFDILIEKYPNAFCHLTRTNHGLWLGASPERLIAIENNRIFRTDALAGTQPFEKGDELINVGWTQKEIEEQAMVSRYIINCFKKIRLREFDEIGPRTIRAGNLTHLRTEFIVDMVDTNTPDLGTTMLELLHPTSAVCGFPRDTANDFIESTEKYDRELYAGFLGPCGFSGNTQLFVNLRCMKIEGAMARLFAGAGITENSIPEKEFAETQHKLQTMLNVLRS